MLHNRFYTGRVRFDGDLIRAPHNAIVSDVLFNACQHYSIACFLDPWVFPARQSLCGPLVRATMLTKTAPVATSSWAERWASS